MQLLIPHPRELISPFSGSSESKLGSGLIDGELVSGILRADLSLRLTGSQQSDQRQEEQQELSHAPRMAALITHITRSYEKSVTANDLGG